MTIEDIFKIKGIVDKKHYVVHKTITNDNHFKAIKTYKIEIFQVIDALNNTIKKMYSVQKVSKVDNNIWQTLEEELLKLVFDGEHFNKQIN